MDMMTLKPVPPENETAILRRALISIPVSIVAGVGLAISSPAWYRIYIVLMVCGVLAGLGYALAVRQLHYSRDLISGDSANVEIHHILSRDFVTAANIVWIGIRYISVSGSQPKASLVFVYRSGRFQRVPIADYDMQQLLALLHLAGLNCDTSSEVWDVWQIRKNLRTMQKQH